MHIVDLQGLFLRLEKVPQLYQADPRSGCIARTQIVGSILHDMGLKVGRAWMLPVFEETSFFAPFYNRKGSPLRVINAPHLPHERHGRMVKWRYHCAVCLIDLPGQPIVDFPLFKGAVRAKSWHKTFLRAQRDCRASPEVEIRLSVHSFQDIPHRHVLRHNINAEKLSQFIPIRRLAQIAAFVKPPRPDHPLDFRRHQGDIRLRRVRVAGE